MGVKPNWATLFSKVEPANVEPSGDTIQTRNDARSNRRGLFAICEGVAPAAGTPRRVLGTTRLFRRENWKNLVATMIFALGSVVTWRETRGQANFSPATC